MSEEIISLQDQAEVKKLMRKAVIYYVAGAPEYQRIMGNLKQVCSNAQWEKVCEMIEEADEFLAESDVGTLCQKERIFAKREQRPDRTPLAFDSEKVRAKKLAILRNEFVATGIKFTDHT